MIPLGELDTLIWIYWRYEKLNWDDGGIKKSRFACLISFSTFFSPQLHRSHAAAVSFGSFTHFVYFDQRKKTVALLCIFFYFRLHFARTIVIKVGCCALFLWPMFMLMLMFSVCLCWRGCYCNIHYLFIYFLSYPPVTMVAFKMRQTTIYQWAMHYNSSHHSIECTLITFKSSVICCRHFVSVEYI